MDADNKRNTYKRMKTLIVGAGKSQRISGAEHQDQFPFEGIDKVFDLNDRWPIESNTYNHIIATHVVEHVNNLIHFMDEAHRILMPGGTLEIETPNAGVNPDLEWCDPTHVRGFRPHTWINYFTEFGIRKFGYTDKEWAISVSTFKLEVPDDCIRVAATVIK